MIYKAPKSQKESGHIFYMASSLGADVDEDHEDVGVKPTKLNRSTRCRLCRACTDECGHSCLKIVQHVWSILV